ncbi:MAG: cytochrome c nitrite reductase small subunit [Pseudobdellovibrionaceae bacterium]|nr:cytochrome c nitrite reductase small subunit [Pseudobdellovibrionaceae bacterium]
MNKHRLSYVLLFIVLGSSTGAFLGLGIFTFHYAKGSSYFTNDPQSCVNCHIMQDNFDSWQMSSHRLTSTCNGCHTPSDFIGKYKTKAIHGIRHSWGFTTGYFKEPLRIKQDSLDIVEANCRQCHGSIFHATDSLASPSSSGTCTSCHRDVGHMR